jgi:hypothetical protein
MMAKRQERQRLMSPGEFAEAVGVTRAVINDRLYGPQSDYWRELLQVAYSGADSKGQMLIPESSLEAWHGAVGPQRPQKSRVGKPRRGAPQGLEHQGRDAHPGLNEILMTLSRRAETVDQELLRQTFVDVGQLGHLLASPNHQVILGRRGTGKTHALAMLSVRMSDRGDLTIPIDLRRVGSTGAYSSRSTPLEQRCTQLLVDVLAAIHDDLVDMALADDDPEMAALLPVLDRFAEAISTVQVVGMVERADTTQASAGQEGQAGAGLTVGPVPQLSLSGARKHTRSTVFERRIVESGTPLLDLNFGAVTRLFDDLTRRLAPRKVWILLDEWSSLPIELQPILADFLRRALLAVPGVIVKIAAIEDRSHFRVPLADGDHMGLELGADITADINLDDFMIFGNDDSIAVDFFSSLLFQHVALQLPDGELTGPHQLVKAAFGNSMTFRELVRAAEGVPRDAINLAALAAQRAAQRTIDISHIKAAARDWYQRDKEGALKRIEARELLSKIIDEVVGRRKVRAFLLERGSRGSEDYAIRELYDARILHLIRRGIPAPNRPSVRYDGFVLDYGCYVDYSLPGYARSSERWKAGVPPDDFGRFETSVLDLAQLRSQPT